MEHEALIVVLDEGHDEQGDEVVEGVDEPTNVAHPLQDAVNLPLHELFALIDANRAAAKHVLAARRPLQIVLPIAFVKLAFL